MKTTIPTSKTVKREWHLIDLEGKVLGRIASNIATLLIGKNKAYYMPHVDCGDYVVVINAAKVKITGKKAGLKIYARHSNYPSGFKEITFEKQVIKDPRKIINSALKGMLPKNKLQAPRLKRLKIFADANHSYQDKFTQK